MTQPTSIEMRNDRFHEGDKSDDFRSRGERDRDRIIYTSALRRLGEITQVASPHETQVLHNRLTHSLEVAQIGKRLAQRLLQEPSGREKADSVGGIDPDVVEAAALAHDLGHPPFGHIAETELKRCVLEAGLADEYEGNAQSFRIVTALEQRHRGFPGLNLSRATLNAILKYPCLHESSQQWNGKWGAYNTERDIFNWARDMFDKDDGRRSAEAEIMDWADDVAYAVHDLEDFYRAGILPIERLRPDSREFVEFLEYATPRVRSETNLSDEALQDIFEDVAGLYFLVTPYDGTRVRRALLRRSTSSLINRYVGVSSAVSIAESDSTNRLFIDARLRAEVELLKQLTWRYVISNPALATAQHGERTIIRELFRIFSEASYSQRDRQIFPVSFQERLNESEPALYPRIVADLISSMTERQAHATYLHLTGMTIGSVRERYDA